tara:strand:+ start:790 stop:1026 length:237 start_codon:yes stop_codon:yes gene_type:complete
MKVYIVKHKTLEEGFKIEGFANRKNAISKISKLKRENKKKLKDKKRTDFVGLISDPKIIIKEIPITKIGILTAINFMK